MGWVPDSDVTDFQDPTWYKAASSWLKVEYWEKIAELLLHNLTYSKCAQKVVPFGFRRLLNWLSQYQKPIIVTENGFSDYLGNVDDLQRIYYYKHYLNQMLKGIISEDMIVN